MLLLREAYYQRKAVKILKMSVLKEFQLILVAIAMIELLTERMGREALSFLCSLLCFSPTNSDSHTSD